MTKSRDNTWLLIALLTLATALIWTGVSIYSTLRKPVLPIDLTNLATPLNPNLDRSFLLSLQTRT